MIDTFETWDYPRGTMFAYWYEGLMAACGWYHLSFETHEIARRYWDHYHYGRR